MDNRGVTRAEVDADAEAPKRGRGCGCWIILILLLLGGGAATGGLVGMTALRQETPLPGEEMMADLAIRTLMIPSEYADMRLPRDITANREESVNTGRELFATQCGFCHGATGKGDAQLGQTMFPPAEDLTSTETQSKSDGQLYWIIAHGMNYTGMPAWGTEYGGPNDDEEIWSMVAYIRSLAGR